MNRASLEKNFPNLTAHVYEEDFIEVLLNLIIDSNKIQIYATGLERIACVNPDASHS